MRSVAVPLPNIRHKTMLDFLLVFPITRQMICKESLFIEEPPYEERHHARKYKEPQYEPSASGVPMRYSDALAYMGWRTRA